MVLSQKALEYAKRRGLTPGEIPAPSPVATKPDVDFDVAPTLQEMSGNFEKTVGYKPLYTSGYRSQQEQDSLPTSDKAKISLHSSRRAMDQSIKGLAPEQVQKAIGFYKSHPGINAFVHGGTADHLHIQDEVERANPDASPPAVKPMGLSDRAKAYAQRRGLKYPGMPEPVVETVSAPKPERTLAGDIKGTAKMGLSMGDGIRRAGNITAAGIIDPILSLAKYAGPLGPQKAADAVVGAMGIKPAPNAVADLADQGLDVLRGQNAQAFEEPPTAFEKVIDFDVAKDPLIPINGEKAARFVQEQAPKIGFDPNGKAIQAAQGVVEPLANLVAGLSTVPNTAMMAAGMKPNIATSQVNRGLMASFVPGMVEGGLEGGKQAIEGIQEGDVRKAVSGGVGALASDLFAAAAARGALRPEVRSLRRAERTPLEVESALKEADLQARAEAFARAPREEILALPPKRPVGRRVYEPEGPPQAYTSESPRSLKRETYLPPRRVVEETPVEFKAQRAIEPESVVTKGEKLFPFLPDEMVVERKSTPLRVPKSLLPREEVGFTTNVQKTKDLTQQYPKAYRAEATTPESAKTLDLQLKSLKSGKQKAVLVTPGEMMPTVPKGKKAIETDVGTWIYDPMKISKKVIQAKVADGSHGEILGHLEPKTPKATQTVAAIKNGVEAKTSIVSPENAQAQAAVLKQQFPDAEIKVGGEELARSVLNDRVGSSEAPLQGIKTPAKPESILQSQAGFVGEPKPKVQEPLQYGEKSSRVYERLKQEMPDVLTENVEYAVKNLKAEADKAVKLIESDPRKAYKVAMGAEKSGDILNTSVNIALSENALKSGNHELYSQLVKKRSLDQTRRGQEIVAEKTVSDNSPDHFVKQLLDARMKKVGKRAFEETRSLIDSEGAVQGKADKITRKIDKEVQKAQKKMGSSKMMDIKKAQALLERLACK